MADEALGIQAMILRLSKLEEAERNKKKPLLQDYLKNKTERKKTN